MIVPPPTQFRGKPGVNESRGFYDRFDTHIKYGYKGALCYTGMADSRLLLAQINRGFDGCKLSRGMHWDLFDFSPFLLNACWEVPWIRNSGSAVLHLSSSGHNGRWFLSFPFISYRVNRLKMYANLSRFTITTIQSLVSLRGQLQTFSTRASPNLIE